MRNEKLNQKGLSLKVPQKTVGGSISLSLENTISAALTYFGGENTECFCKSLLLEKSVPLAD